MRTPDVEAELTFLTPEQGGRHTPVSTGYRGDLFYRGQNHVTLHEFLGTQSVDPGKTVNVLMRFLNPQVLHEHLRLNDKIESREASQTVARGKITRVIDLVLHGEGAQG